MKTTFYLVKKMEMLAYELQFKIANYILKLDSTNPNVIKDFIAHFSPSILKGVHLKIGKKELDVINGPHVK